MLYVSSCLAILTVPWGTLGSSDVTKYAGILWPHQSWREIHQSLQQEKSFTIKVTITIMNHNENDDGNIDTII